jgi:hypothetical protein
VPKYSVIGSGLDVSKAQQAHRNANKRDEFTSPRLLGIVTCDWGSGWSTRQANRFDCGRKIAVYLRSRRIVHRNGHGPSDYSLGLATMRRPISLHLRY